jgi:hypothetical protein
MTDLCAQYQENTTKLQRSANLSDEEKSVCVKLHQEHLDKAKSERECYRKACEEAKDNVASFQQEFDFTHAHSKKQCTIRLTMPSKCIYTEQSNAAWPNLLQDATEMRNIRCFI